jgi:hypothetical protein
MLIKAGHHPWCKWASSNQLKALRAMTEVFQSASRLHVEILPDFPAFNLRLYHHTGHWWLTPVIVATQEAEIKRIAVQSQPWANSS